MLNLALTFGLEKQPLTALERMTGYVEKVARKYAVENPLQMTLGLFVGAVVLVVGYKLFLAWLHEVLEPPAGP